MSSPAALIATAKVRAGSEDAFAAWKARHDAALAKFPGFISSDIMPPDKHSDMWTIILNFRSTSELTAWQQSKDFSTGRESIVTAPGPGVEAKIKVFAFPLLKPIAKADRESAQPTDQPVNTSSFVPFGDSYRGGVSLAIGWLAGTLG